MKFLCGAALAAFLSAPVSARAAVFWQGDAETGDTKQWSFQLNPRGLSVVTEPVREGSRAYRVEITPADLWPNGLNRVELQHKPGASRVAVGKETYFAWSFFLPAALSDDSHQIGYWESDQTYRQVMSLTVKGQNVQFETRLPNNRVHWMAAGKATAGKWHDVVMHIKWAQADTGEVSLWFDGTKVVNAVKAQTMADANPLFVQVGMLRGKKDAPAEVMYIDRAKEGSSLQDVQAPVTAPMDAGTMNTADAGVGGSSGAGGSAGQSGSGGSAGAGGNADSNGGGGKGGTGASGGGRGDDEEGGRGGESDDESSSGDRGKTGGCTVSPRAVPSYGGMALVAACALAAILRRRRGS